MNITKEQRDKINELAASFVERSDVLIALSATLEYRILQAMKLEAERNAEGRSTE